MKIMINFIQENAETGAQVTRMLQALASIGLNLGRESISDDLHVFPLIEFDYRGPHRFTEDYDRNKHPTFEGKNIHILACPLCGAEVFMLDSERIEGTTVICDGGGTGITCGLKYRHNKHFSKIMVSL